MAAGSSPSPLVLRVAVYVDGALTSELHQEWPASLSAGTHYGNDLLLFGPKSPSRYALFQYRAGRFILDVPRGARGKVKIQGRKIGIRKLYAAGLRRIELDEAARGRIVFGDTKIVFEQTTPEPVAPKPPFPPEFRVTLGRTVTAIEGLYLRSLLASALTLGSLFAWASFAPIPETAEVEIEERFLVVMNAPKPRKDAPEDEAEEEPEEPSTLAKQAKRSTKKDTTPEPKVLEDKPQRFTKQAMNQARSVGVARVLGTYGGPGEGTVFDVINETENDLGELFARGMTSTVMADGGDVSAFVPGGEGITQHGSAMKNEGLKTDGGPTLARKEAKKERKVRGKTRATRTNIIGDADKTALRATIKYRTGALQHCYNKALRTQPDLSGKMTFTIFVNVMGSVTKVLVEEDSLGSSSVQTCTKAKIKGWRFPMEGAEEEAEVTFSVVFSGS